MAGQGVVVVANLSTTVLLARLLSPEAFGLVAMATAVTAFAALFRDVGLSAASVQAATVSEEQRSSLFWLNIFVSTVIAVAVAVSSPVVASYFRRPELVLILVALAPQFILSGAAAQHGALLARDLRFGTRAVSAAAGAVLTFGCSLTAALLGADYWSLVIGALAGTAGTASILIAASGWRPLPQVSWSSVRRMVQFGAHVTIFEIVNYFHRNLDNVLIGRRWGAVELGSYSRAYQLLMFPVSNIRVPINAVAFPVLSRLSDTPDSYRRFFLRVSFLVAAVTMPLAAVLFVLSDDIVLIALGPDWYGVADIFAVLAIVAFLQPWAGLRGLLMMTMGRSKRYAAWGVANAALVSIGFIIGLKWKGLGVAVAYACVNYALLLPSTWWAVQGTPVTQRAFLRSGAAPAFSSSVAGLVTFHLLAATQFQLHWRVTLGTAVFSVAYFAVLLSLPSGRAECRELWNAIRDLRSARREGSPSRMIS